MTSGIIRAVAALVCLVIVVCGPASPAPEREGAWPNNEPRSGGILRIGQNTADLGTLNPHFTPGDAFGRWR